jgi:hypothetical protein
MISFSKHVVCCVAASGLRRIFEYVPIVVTYLPLCFRRFNLCFSTYHFVFLRVNPKQCRLSSISVAVFFLCPQVWSICLLQPRVASSILSFHELCLALNFGKLWLCSSLLGTQSSLYCLLNLGGQTKCFCSFLCPLAK